MVRAAYLAMELTAWFIIVPLSLASPVTGLVQSLGTAWGLFRHYTGVGPGRESSNRRPRWVNVFGIIVIVLVLIFVIKHLIGGGLGGHTP